MNLRPLSNSKRSWLLSELAIWRGGGLLSDDQAGHILDLYESSADSERRHRSIAIFALCGLAVLMIGLAVLLLVGHNWQAMPKAAKLAVLFGTLLGVYAAAFYLRYRRGMMRTSELIFFLSSFFYGVTIWLIAQIFNIQSHYPDGLWFWALGVMPFALCLDTILLHILYVALLGVWVGTEIFGFPSFRPWFFHHFMLPNGAWSLPLMALPGLVWAYRKRSVAAVAIYVPLLAWWAILQPVALHTEQSMFYFIGAIGSILLLAGQSHAADNPLAKPYHAWGTLMAGSMLIPFSFSDFMSEVLQHPNCFDWVYGSSQFHGYCVASGLLCLMSVLAILASLWLPRSRAATQVQSPSTFLTQKIANTFTKFSDQRERVDASRAEARMGWRPCRSEILQRQWTPIAMTAFFVALNLWVGIFQRTHDQASLYATAWDFQVLTPVLAANVMMVVFSLWLMRQGLQSDRGLVFTVGVLYFLLWTILRYCDLFANIGGMLGASMMFLLCGVGLFAVARYWHSHKEKGHA